MTDASRQAAHSRTLRLSRPSPRMRLLLSLAAFGASLATTTDGTCPKVSAPINKNRGGCDQKQLSANTYAACQTACCADSLCASWNWDSNLTSGRPPPCKIPGSGCCWLKTCDKGPGAPAPACPGSSGCTSWSGSSGRPEPPAPPLPPLPPPPAPICPSGPGKPCFYNHGTRPGVTASYDCEMRKHVRPHSIFRPSPEVPAPQPN